MKRLLGPLPVTSIQPHRHTPSLHSRTEIQVNYFKLKYLNTNLSPYRTANPTPLFAFSLSLSKVPVGLFPTVSLPRSSSACRGQGQTACCISGAKLIFPKFLPCQSSDLLILWTRHWGFSFMNKPASLCYEYPTALHSTYLALQSSAPLQLIAGELTPV